MKELTSCEMEGLIPYLVTCLVYCEACRALDYCCLATLIAAVPILHTISLLGVSSLVRNSSNVHTCGVGGGGAGSHGSDAVIKTPCRNDSP
jgi:hypothetical protein